MLRRNYGKLFDEDLEVRSVLSIQDLNDVKIDAVFICTPTSLYLKGIEITKEKEAAILENTLSHNAQDLERAELLLQSYHRSFFIGFTPRYHPLVKKIKEIINSNLLGKTYSARFEFGSCPPFWHPWEDYRVSYASKAELGGEVINTISHELDLVQHFFWRVQNSYRKFKKSSQT